MTALASAGHQVELVGELDPGARPDVLIVDLTVDAPARIERARAAAAPTIAFYSHVEMHVRELAEQAGFVLVVPRSRMAREAAQLVDKLVSNSR